MQATEVHWRNEAKTEVVSEVIRSSQFLMRASKISWMLGRRPDLRMGRIPGSSEEQRSRNYKYRSVAGAVWYMTVNHFFVLASL